MKTTTKKTGKVTYKVNGDESTTHAGASWLALSHIVKKYGWEQINEQFREAGAYRESIPLLQPLKDAIRRSEKHTRYFLHEDDILKDKNGVKVCVSNSFSSWNMDNFIKYLRTKHKMSISVLRNK